MSAEIRLLGPGDAAVLMRAAPDVFDDPVLEASARAFLEDSRHHIAVAVDDGVVVGFASGVHYLHPDKPDPEMWINEVGVALTHQGRGLGRAVVRALAEEGRRLGCHVAWVLTDRSNPVAMRLYASAGGVQDELEVVLYTFSLE